jgi:hypothetical protein
MGKASSKRSSDLPLIVAFEDLDDAQRYYIEQHPMLCSKPIQSRVDPHRWLVGFDTGHTSRPVVYASIARWARASGMRPPRRVT